MSFCHKFEYRQIMESLYNAFLPLVDKVYVTSRPAISSETPRSYIVIRNSSGMRDRGDTYQTAKFLIHIFVKDKANGIEDTVSLDTISHTLCDLMPFMTPQFTAFDPNFIASGEDSGYHYHIIQLSLTIHKIDSRTENLIINL